MYVPGRKLTSAMKAFNDRVQELCFLKYRITVVDFVL